jgi:hypothetical protein
VRAKTNASNTNNTSSSTTQPAGKASFPKGGGKAVDEAHGLEECQGGSTGSEGGSGSA